MKSSFKVGYQDFGFIVIY